MVSRTRFKSFMTGLGLYVLAGLLIGYFWINAFTGKYGLNAQQELDQEMVALKDELGRLKSDRTEWERRVALLRSDKLDPDMLDERVRAQLEFVSPRDLVMTIKR